MGRVSKYKKVKKTRVNSDGIWGFGDNGARPKKISRTAEKLRQQKINRRLKRMKDPNTRTKFQSSYKQRSGMNCPPSDTEDEFDIADVQGSLKRQKQESSILEEPDTQLPTVKCTTNSRMPNDAIERKEAKESSKYEARGKKESKKAYNQRFKEETMHIIKQTKMAELNLEKRKRKKEFLNQKKKGKHPAKGSTELHMAQKDVVPFGHQVERPPNFKSLPRGASLNAKKANTSRRAMDVQTELENLERLRQKVQEQYAVIKAKRKRTGEFHL